MDFSSLLEKIVMTYHLYKCYMLDNDTLKSISRITDFKPDLYTYKSCVGNNVRATKELFQIKLSLPRQQGTSRFINELVEEFDDPMIITDNYAIARNNYPCKPTISAPQYTQESGIGSNYMLKLPEVVIISDEIDSDSKIYSKVKQKLINRISYENKPIVLLDFSR